MKTGLFLCNCKNNIDLSYGDIKSIEGFEVVELCQNLCNKDLEALKKDLDRNQEIDSLVFGCDEKIEDYYKIAKKHDIEKENISSFNAKNICSYPHESEEAKLVAERISKGLRNKIQNIEDPRKKEIRVGDSVLVYSSTERGKDIAELLATQLDVKLLQSKNPEAIEEDEIGYSVERGELAGIDGEIGDFDLEIVKQSPINYSSCIKCGLCKRTCPENCINDQYQINKGCTRCGRCVEKCPADAIEFDRYETKKEKFDQILIDKNKDLETSLPDKKGIYPIRQEQGLKSLKGVLKNAGGWRKKIEIFLSENECTATERKGIEGCRLCIDICPTNAISKKGKGIEIDWKKCSNCGYCTSICPISAIKSVSENNKAIFSQIEGILNGREGWLKNSLDKEIILFCSREKWKKLEKKGLEEKYPPILPIKIKNKSISSSMILKAFNTGADGVIIVGEKTEPIKLTKKILEKTNLNNRLIHLKDINLEEIRNQYNKITPLSKEPKETSSIQNRKSLLENTKKLEEESENNIEYIKAERFGDPTINQKCTSCKSCINLCPTKALRAKGEEIYFKNNLCIGCEICEEVCPENALDLDKKIDFRYINKEKELKQFNMIKCKKCGEPFITEQALKELKQELDGFNSQTFQPKFLEYCEECRAEVSIKSLDLEEQI